MKKIVSLMVALVLCCSFSSFADGVDEKLTLQEKDGLQFGNHLKVEERVRENTRITKEYVGLVNEIDGGTPSSYFVNVYKKYKCQEIGVDTGSVYGTWYEKEWFYGYIMNL